MFGIRVNKLKAIAKGIPLANPRTNRHGTAWKHEAQLHEFAQLNFNCQHGSDPGFADVHAMALQLARRVGIDYDINLKFEPGPPTGIRERLKRAHGGRILTFHIPDFLRLSILYDNGTHSKHCIPFGIP